MAASVRMGEMHISSTSGDELVAIGLGSCIGLALLDRSPASPAWPMSCSLSPGTPPVRPGKFADLAIAELLAHVSAPGLVANGSRP